MDKYLVTGACGFTGSHTCDLLYERGIPFRATDIAGANRQWLPPDAEFVSADITNAAEVEPLMEGIDIVLHPAAIFDWSATEEQLNAVNVTGMENMCAAAKKAGIKRFVSWSTSGVYGNQQFDTLPICEDYPVKPIDKYSISKHKQDKIALRYCAEEGLPTTIIRPGIVYGPRAKYGAMQFFDTFAMLPVIPIPVNFDKYKLGTIHARDIGGAALFAATKPGSGRTDLRRCGQFGRHHSGILQIHRRSDEQEHHPALRSAQTVGKNGPCRGHNLRTSRQTRNQKAASPRKRTAPLLPDLA